MDWRIDPTRRWSCDIASRRLLLMKIRFLHRQPQASYIASARKRTHKVPVKAQQSEASTSAPLYHRNGGDTMQQPATVSETASIPRMNAVCRDIHLQGRGLSEKLVTLWHYRNYRSSFSSPSVASSDLVFRLTANSVTLPARTTHKSCMQHPQRHHESPIRQRPHHRPQFWRSLSR